MKNKYFQIIILSLTLIFQYSCKNNIKHSANIEIINIDFNNVKELDINRGEIITLENTKNSLLSNIESAAFLRDKILILSRSKLTAFDTNGKFIFDFGNIGRSGNEYLSINSFYEKDDKIYIYDWATRKMLTFSHNGHHINNFPIVFDHKSNDVFPSTIIPLSNGTYIARNTYRGSSSTPEFSLLNNNLKYIKDYKGLNRVDGASYSDLLPSSENSIIYNRMLSDTLYRIDSSSIIKPAYYVDFGKHKLTQEAKKGKDYVDLIQESNKQWFINNIATLIRYRYETKDELMFIFAFNLGVHFVIYNKDSKSVNTFILKDSLGRFKPEMFISYQKDHIYISASLVNNIDSNPVLIRLNYDLFKQ